MNQTITVELKVMRTQMVNQPSDQWVVKIGRLTLLHITISGGWFFYTVPNTNRLLKFNTLEQAIESIETMLGVPVPKQPKAKPRTKPVVRAEPVVDEYSKGIREGWGKRGPK